MKFLQSGTYKCLTLHFYCDFVLGDARPILTHIFFNRFYGFWEMVSIVEYILTLDNPSLKQDHIRKFWLHGVILILEEDLFLSNFSRPKKSNLRCKHANYRVEIWKCVVHFSTKERSIQKWLFDDLQNVLTLLCQKVRGKN